MGKLSNVKKTVYFLISKPLEKKSTKKSVKKGREAHYMKKPLFPFKETYFYPPHVKVPWKAYISTRDTAAYV